VCERKFGGNGEREGGRERQREREEGERGIERGKKEVKADTAGAAALRHSQSNMRRLCCRLVFLDPTHLLLIKTLRLC
jgi:hypothetical protein